MAVGAAGSGHPRCWPDSLGPRPFPRAWNAPLGGHRPLRHPLYNISCKEMVHVDIAEKKLVGIPNAVVSSIESMPFPNGRFDSIVCVGSVINYCDAGAVVAEFSRVAKPGAVLILEFENSGGFEYRKEACYKESAAVVTVQFQGVAHTQWLYSVPYIKSLLKAHCFSIEGKTYRNQGQLPQYYIFLLDYQV